MGLASCGAVAFDLAPGVHVRTHTNMFVISGGWPAEEEPIASRVLPPRYPIFVAAKIDALRAANAAQLTLKQVRERQKSAKVRCERQSCTDHTHARTHARTGMRACTGEARLAAGGLCAALAAPPLGCLTDPLHVRCSRWFGAVRC